MKYLFLDTNIFLHFQNFEQIPWGNLVGDVNFKIIVSDIVAGEIDKHKDGARGKIQKKAKVISKLLGDVLLGDKKLSISLGYCMSCPEKLPDEVRAKFNQSSQDDQILMGILASDYPKENVVVVSYDNPILIKAKAHGLCFLRMPDEFLLKEELSEEEKELERCKKEIAAYKNRMSKPVLLLNKERVCLKIKRSPIFDIEKELAKHMQIIRSQHPYKELPSITKDTTPFSSVFEGCFIIDKDGVKNYNNYLDSYYGREEKFYRTLLEKKMLDERMYELSFSLSNEGTDETGNVDVFVEFPAGLKLYNNESNMKVDVDKPQLPPPYRPFYDPRLNEAFRNLSPASNSMVGYINMWNLGADISEKDFAYKASHVNHHVVHNLCDGGVLYIDKENCGNFKIEYHIIDSKHKDRIDGVINVVIEE